MLRGATNGRAELDADLSSPSSRACACTAMPELIGKLVASGRAMPLKKTLERAKRDRAAGKSASTQAGEFVREEMHHIREGKHGAKNAKQAIAIGLSKARRAGVDAAPGPDVGPSVRRKAARDSAHANRPPNPRRAKATSRALKRAPNAAASPAALSRHARASAEKRRKQGGSNSPSAAAQRAANTRKRRQRAPRTA